MPGNLIPANLDCLVLQNEATIWKPSAVGFIDQQLQLI